MNLSALSGQELRRLLDASRARGDASLAYQILQEMAERRDARQERGRSLLARRPAEPRVVALNLDDPAEDELPPMPKWRAPELVVEPEAVAEPEPEAVAAPEPKPAPRRSRRSKTQPPPIAAVAPVAQNEDEPTTLAPKPRSVWDDDPPPVEDKPAHADVVGLRLDRPERVSPREPRKFRRPPGIGFAAGIALGAAVGWWAAGSLQTPAPPAAPAAVPIQTAALEPQPAPATLPVTVAAAEPVPEPTPEAPPEPTGGPLPPDLQEGPLLSPDAADEAVEPSPPPAAVVRAANGGGATACAAEPTPADREICGDPELRRLQRELRQAYAEALEAHEDRDLLRQRQLAWRDARNTISEPDRLARLYEQRIRKLNAATAEARHQQ